MITDSDCKFTPFNILIVDALFYNTEKEKEIFKKTLCRNPFIIVSSTLFRSVSRTTLSIQEDDIIVLISWMVVIFFSAWPFLSILEISLFLGIV